MKYSKIAIIAFCFLPLTGALARDSVSTSSNVLKVLLDCKAIKTAEERLACFDRESSNLVTAEQDKQIVVLDREGMKRAKRNIFGFSLPKINLFGGSENEEPEVTQIDGVVASSRGLRGGMWAFSLQDGTVWQTTETRLNSAPSVGQKATIKAGILGSYVAKFGNGGSLRVKRTR